MAFANADEIVPQLRARTILADGRLESWQHAVSQSVVPVRCRAMRPQTDGALELGVRGLCRSAGLVLVRGGSHEVVGCPATASDELMWIIQLDGAMRFKHGGIDTDVGTGEARLYDPQNVHSMTFKTQFVQLLFRFPRAWLHGRNLELGAGADLRRGQGSLAWQYLLNMLTIQDGLEIEEAEAAAAAAVSLFAGSVQRYGSPSGPQTRLEQIKQQLMPLIGRNALTPDMAAECVGMTVRTLANVFAREDDTLGSWIMRRRLSQASLDLRRDPSTSIAEIAYRWGFADQAHFSRAFCRLFGRNPRSFRKESMS